MNTRYLEPVTGARWAISRIVNGKRIYLVQNTSMDSEEDISAILRTLTIDVNEENINHYFPLRGRQGRCPTLDLLELFSTIDRVVVEQKPAVTV